MTDGRLQWHPGFSAALRVELEEELDELCIEDEHMLSKKPMQIDVLIVKKKGKQPIRKNIGRIFRKHNIIEYKSPEDYLSVNDFYKVYGYTCFYQSETKRVKEIQPEEITITFICNHYPQKLLEHLRQFKGIEVKYADDGNLQGECEKALQQIIDIRYTEALEQEGIHTIIKYGIACYRKKCKVLMRIDKQ